MLTDRLLLIISATLITLALLFSTSCIVWRKMATSCVRQKTIDPFTTSSTPIRVIYFYMDTCPFCVEFEPIWQNWNLELDRRKETNEERYGAVSTEKHNITNPNNAVVHQYRNMFKTVPAILFVNGRGDKAVLYDHHRSVENLNAAVDKLLDHPDRFLLE
jgi:hypothetical protein